MVNIDFDKSKGIRLRARTKETSVVKSFNFVDPAGNNIDITNLDFQLIVQKGVASRKNLFVLTIGDGLTISGDDNSVLEIEISADRATQIADTYFYRLFSVLEDNTWFNGPFQFHDGEFNSEECDDTITIGAQQTINIILSGGGGETMVDGMMVLCVDEDGNGWDLSNNVVPQTGGTGNSGSIKKGNAFPVDIGNQYGETVVGRDGGPIAAGTIALARVNIPGINLADVTKWMLIYSQR